LVKNIINKMILGNKFIISILVAFILSDTSHKLLPYVIGFLLFTIGLKATKKIWNV
jgi:glycerol uptake facilitator-like aquaporin